MEQKKFEYTSATMPPQVTPADLKVILNKWGEEGWELVSTEYGSFIFKRAILNIPS